MSRTNSTNQNNDVSSIPQSKHISQTFFDAPYQASGLNKGSFDYGRKDQNTATPGLRSQVKSETLRKNLKT